MFSRGYRMETECGEGFPGCIRKQETLRRVNEMTESVEINVAEALALIDQGLGLTMSRDLMSTNEVADLLLDVRSILAAAPIDDVPEAIPAPVS